MKLLPLVFALSGCVSTTHAIATSKHPDECVPFAALAADFALGMVGTYGGILYDEPSIAASGGVYLGLSTVLLFAQMGECVGH
jgi:hypothetical protein